jgi:hypothetical protein
MRVGFFIEEPINVGEHFLKELRGGPGNLRRTDAPVHVKVVSILTVRSEYIYLPLAIEPLLQLGHDEVCMRHSLQGQYGALIECLCDRCKITVQDFCCDSRTPFHKGSRSLTGQRIHDTIVITIG